MTRRDTDRAAMATRALAALTAAGAGALAYASLVEVRWFALRTATVPVLPSGARPLRVLHLSDLHLVPSQRRKRSWLSGLAELRPDLVVNTGDNLAHPDAVPAVLDALDELLDVPGVFVLGSNDYFAPTLRNPVKYLLPDDGTRHVHARQLPWRDLREGFEKRGWVDLDNCRESLTVGGVDLAFAGVDDPHLGYDDLAAVAGPADPAAVVRLGVTHAPYLRVLDQFAQDGYDLILAGHTHGGQLRLPGVGALVTNCDLDTGRARGLHRYDDAWLHVSAGLGTSPYAPVRFGCRPEATLLTLTPRSVS